MHGARTILLVIATWTAASHAKAQQPPFYPDKANLLVLRVGDRDVPIRTPAEWDQRRGHILANMELVMGPMPKIAKLPLDVKIVEEVKLPQYTRKLLTYQSGPGNRVPAYLLVPHNLKAKAAAILCLHPTNPKLGKGVVVGFGPKYDRAYAVHLAERGYVTLAPDYVDSGDYHFDPYKNGFASATLLGIWNHRRAVDLLQSLPEVDGERLGVIGHSLGGHNSMFVAAFEPRLKVIVSSCGFNSFSSYMKGNLAGWSHKGYMPRIREVYDLKPEKMPFDFPEVTAALAPRAFLAVAPLRDNNFEVGGVKECIAAAAPVYRLLGAADKLRAIYPDAGHDFPDEARNEAYA
ncbi:MAG: prolyl oligopeptidase family serine peptidase, partial [Gemmataceae bacterium]|nr:prolyl oligopeptidase family serine peptidase [Gemmataceae bacterium]